MEREHFRVYIVTNLINYKQYVGITLQSIERRWSQHCSIKSECPALRDSIQEFGKENFKIEQIISAINIDSLNYLEEFLIKSLNTLAPNGYNLSSGGKYCVMSDITKEKHSINMIERHKKSDLTLALRNAQIKKRKPIVGINFKTFEIFKFESIHSAHLSGIYPDSVLTGEINYANNCMWYYDEGQTDVEFIENTKLLNIKTKGVTSWLKSDRTQRLKAMRDGSSHRFKSAIAINIKSGEAKIYENMHDVERAGFSFSSVYNSINKNALKGQGHVWFRYDKNVSIEFYVNKAKDELGGFDNTYLIPIKSTNIKTGEIIIYKNCEEVANAGFQVKSVRRVLRECRSGKRTTYSGFKWEYLA